MVSIFFYDGRSKYDLAETINAVVDRYPLYRALLGVVGSMLSRWEESEPVRRAMVLPLSILKAAVAVALVWKWRKMAAAMLLGFHALLRPSKFLHIQRRRLVLPADVLSTDPVCYIALLNTKTKRFVHRQHARITDEVTVAFLAALFGAFEAPLFGASPSVFRARWNAIFKALHLPTDEANNGITPKSLRGSGASKIFLVCCGADAGRLAARSNTICKIPWGRAPWPIFLNPSEPLF